MLHEQSFHCVSKAMSIMLWIQLACVRFSQYPVLLEIQYKVMFRHKVMWSRGPHRPVAWNKVCSGLKNNHLDRRVAAHSFPTQTIQWWELQLKCNFMTGRQVSQTEKLALLFFNLLGFFPFLLHTSKSLWRNTSEISDLVRAVALCLNSVFTGAFSKLISCFCSALYRRAFIKNCLPPLLLSNPAVLLVFPTAHRHCLCQLFLLLINFFFSMPDSVILWYQELRCAAFVNRSTGVRLTRCFSWSKADRQQEQKVFVCSVRQKKTTKTNNKFEAVCKLENMFARWSH